MLRRPMIVVRFRTKKSNQNNVTVTFVTRYDVNGQSSWNNLPRRGGSSPSVRSRVADSLAGGEAGFPEERLVGIPITGLYPEGRLQGLLFTQSGRRDLNSTAPMRGRCFIDTYVREATALARTGSYGPANIMANIFAASVHCRGCLLRHAARMKLRLRANALIAPSAAQ